MKFITNKWVLFLTTVISWGTYEVVDKFALNRVSVLVATLYKHIFSVAVFPFLLWYVLYTKQWVWDAKAFWLMMLSCFLTTIADIAFLALLQRYSFGVVVSSTIAVGVAIAVILGAILFHDHLTWRHYVGFVAVIGGIYLIST